MAPEKDWYRTWFNSPYYHILYQNRNLEEAHYFIDHLIEYLQPSPQAKMLDLACGKGRHSLYLCRKGYEVTGVDLSKENIKAAKEIKCGNLYFDVHDMREPYAEENFDYVFNFFTSFGYFEKEQDNIRTTNAISFALKPEGICVVDFLNAQLVIDKLDKEEVITRDGITFHIKRDYKDGFILKRIKFEADGQHHTFYERVQALQLSDFKRLFEAAGMEIIDAFGNYQLEAYDPQRSSRLIIAAKKVT